MNGNNIRQKTKMSRRNLSRVTWKKLLPPLTIILAAAFGVGLASCNSPVSIPGADAPALVISLHDNIGSRTLQPGLDMSAASYAITGTGPDSATFTRTSTGEPVTVNSLAFGSWTIVVQANNADSTLIGLGQTTTTVNSGETSSVSVTVTPISGLGTLNLDLNWPAAQVQTPSVVSTLTPALGSAIPLSFTLGTGTAVYANPALPNGYYTLTVKLQDNGITVMGAVEIARMVTGQATTGSYHFDNINQPGGSIVVNISPDMREPLLVSMSGVPATKAQNQSMTLSASVSNYSGNLTYVWYVNGDSVATGADWTMDSSYAPGYYRVDVTAFTNDGTRAGSATAQVRVVDQVQANTTNLVAAGWFYSLALKSDGSLWAFGDNTYGQLGDGSTIRRAVPVEVMTNVVSVAAGHYQSFALKADGTLWGFGANYWGQLGDGTTIDRHSPVQVMSGVSSMATAALHTLVVKTDGTLWTFGYNDAGQLGDGTTISRATPMQIMTGVKSAAGGYFSSLVLKTDGTLWSFGQNTNGQLGDGTTIARSSPVQIMSGVSTISAGGDLGLVVKLDGSLWTFGFNGYGQLGDGSTIDRAVPLQVMTGIERVAAGFFHSLALKTDSTLYSFGQNGSGQLGIGNITDSAIPMQVMSGIRNIAAGGSHSIVLKTDGTLWTFGYNNSGELGDGTTTNSNVPIQVPGWLY